MVNWREGLPPVQIQVLHERGAQKISDDGGKVISEGDALDRIRLAALPLFGEKNGGRRYDFAGFVEKAGVSFFNRFWEKLFHKHITFDAVYTKRGGEEVHCTAWVRVESVRKRLGIGDQEMDKIAKGRGIWRDFTGIWKKDVVEACLDPVRNSCRFVQVRQEHQMGPREKFARERVMNPEHTGHRLNMDERHQILDYVAANWSVSSGVQGIEVGLQEGHADGSLTVSVDIKKADSGLPYDLVVLSRKETAEAPLKWELFVVLEKKGQAEGKEVYPAINFYRPQNRFFIAKEDAEGLTAREDDVRIYIGDGAVVSRPLCRLNGGRALYSVDDELGRLAAEYPVLSHSPSKRAGDLLHILDALHHHGGGVQLGAFNPVTFVAESEDGEPVERGALLGLEYATTPGQRAADPMADTFGWGNPIYFAPEVAREASARRGRRRVFYASDQDIRALEEAREALTSVAFGSSLGRLAFKKVRDGLVEKIDRAKEVVLRARDAENQRRAAEMAIEAVEQVIAAIDEVVEGIGMSPGKKEQSYFKYVKDTVLVKAKEALMRTIADLELHKSQCLRVGQAMSITEDAGLSPFSESSDMWTLGLRIMNLLRNSAEEPCPEVRALIRVGLAREKGDRGVYPVEPQDDLDRLRMIAGFEGDLLEAPEDKTSLKYLAYLMLRAEPEKRITAREALRRYYGMVIHRVVSEINGFSERYEVKDSLSLRWQELSETLLRAVDGNLLGRDMRSDRLERGDVLWFYNHVEALAQEEEELRDTGLVGELLVCLGQLYQHPSEVRGRAYARRGRRGL